jgi:hypothetical protein
LLLASHFYRSPTRDSKSRKKAKRARSLSSSPDDSSEEDRRKRKERKRAKKERGRERKERRRRGSRDRRRSYDDDSDEERKHRKSRHSSRDESRGQSEVKELSGRSRSPSRSKDSNHSDEVEGEWVEKPPRISDGLPAATSSSNVTTSHPAQPAVESGGDDSDDDIGPQPLQKINARKVDERAYGGALLRGEGSAMAAFLQDGTESRIPRRGEIGLTSDEIAKYEAVGYVMSGSRHRRMNAVRMRKENQVISAEEKRGILKLQKEERERRETILREEFGELVNERLKGTDGGTK